MRNLLLIVLLFFISTGFAASGITLNKYYDAKCDNYTGTWTGFVTDAGGLFGNGGPWPVTVSLSNQNGQVVGRVSQIRYAKNSNIDSAPLYASCKDGVLEHIYWGVRKDCGALSEQGTLVSKNALVLTLDYENAMTNTILIAFLQRKNNAYPYPIPKKLTPEKIQSCH